MLYIIIKKLLFKENKTFLQIFMIALLVSLQVFSYSILTNTQRYFSDTLSISQPEFVYAISYNSSTLSNSTLHYAGQTIKSDSIKLAIPILSLEVSLKGTKITIEASNEEFLRMPGLQINGEASLTGNKALVGGVLANLFNLTRDKEITLKINDQNITFKVVAIITTYKSFDYKLIINLNYIWDKIPALRDKISYILLYPSEKSSLDDIKISLENVLQQQIKLLNNNKYEIANEVFEGPVNLLDKWSFAINLVVLIMSFLIAANNARRFKKYAGIMTALGMTRNGFSVLFLLENLMVLALGMIWGVSIGLISASFLTKFISSISETPLIFSPDYFKITFNISTLIIFAIIGYILSLLRFNKTIKNLLE